MINTVVRWTKPVKILQSQSQSAIALLLFLPTNNEIVAKGRFTKVKEL